MVTKLLAFASCVDICISPLLINANTTALILSSSKLDI